MCHNLLEAIDLLEDQVDTVLRLAELAPLIDESANVPLYWPHVMTVFSLIADQAREMSVVLTNTTAALRAQAK